jgi:hypothetical protein
MKRLRLSTLMLLIVIAALSTALVVQHIRASRREAESQSRLAQSWPLFVQKKLVDKNYQEAVKAMNERAVERAREGVPWRAESGAQQQPK